MALTENWKEGILIIWEKAKIDYRAFEPLLMWISLNTWLFFFLEIIEPPLLGQLSISEY